MTNWDQEAQSPGHDQPESRSLKILLIFVLLIIIVVTPTCIITTCRMLPAINLDPPVNMDPILSLDPPANLDLENRTSMIFVGGYNGTTWTTTVYSRMWEETAWIKRTDMPRMGLSHYSCSGHGEWVYITGGCLGHVVQDRCDKWSAVSGAWHPMAAMKQVRKYHMAVYCNGALYAIGGYDGQSELKSVELYNINEDMWHYIPDMPKVVEYPHVACHRENLYVLGGYEENAAYIYSIITSQWMTISPLPDHALHLNSLSVGKYIYVVGGKNRMCFRYFQSTGTWMLLRQPKLVRVGSQLVVHDGLIYHAGGYDTSTSPWKLQDTVSVYNPTSNKWHMAKWTLPHKAAWFGLVLLLS